MKKLSHTSLAASSVADGTARLVQPGPPMGEGWAIAHHGELLQGVFESRDGRLHRGLVTLPMPALQTHAVAHLDGASNIYVDPPDRHKAAHAASIVLGHLGYHEGGRLTLDSRIAVGHGYGSSTADVVATIRAVAAARDVNLPRQTIAELAVQAEGASDAIVYDDQAILFAHREGLILEHFGPSLPPLLVIGLTEPDVEEIDTLRFPRARYGPEEIQVFKVLRGLMRRAVDQQNPWLAGRVATVSAQINQRYLPKPQLTAVQELAEHHRACGVQVAHSGTAMGILLDPAMRNAARRAREIAQAATAIGLEAHHIFLINAEKPSR